MDGHVVVGTKWNVFVSCNKSPVEASTMREVDRNNCPAESFCHCPFLDFHGNLMGAKVTLAVMGPVCGPNNVCSH